MRTDDGFERFGAPTEFALDLKLLPDPDGDRGAPLSSVGSWGQWRLWVGGTNLCEHDLVPDDATAVRCPAVTWYLAPLMRWFAGNWDALLHEERLPLRRSAASARRAPTARHAYISALESSADDIGRFTPWQDWASRHSLRWAADGGLFPDIFLRRLGDEIEAGWGDRWQPGGEAAQFVLESGSALASAAAVSKALDAALRWFVSCEPLRSRPWFDAVAGAVDARSREGAEAARLAWHIDAAPEPGPLTRLFQRLRAQYGGEWSGVFGGRRDDLCLTRLSPAAAMFGALSPEFDQEAAIRLLAITADSLARGAAAAAEIDRYVDQAPLRLDHPAWDQGYGLARTFMDDADTVPDPDDGDPHSVDIDGLLARLGVTRFDEALGARGPRGVALAGDGIAPTIVLNRDHPMNKHEPGRRFTAAHELCHILYDRDRARRVTHVSTPWAPAAVEQRANAFAAMLLMPPELIRRMAPDLSEDTDLETAAGLAKAMKVGRRAIISHLANLGEISDETREELLAEMEHSFGDRTERNEPEPEPEPPEPGM